VIENEAVTEKRVVIEKELTIEIAKGNEVMTERVQEKIEMNQRKKGIGQNLIQLPRSLP
jgi:hypothetical protein